MRVGIATDHVGFGLKEELVAQLRAAGHEVIDFGANTLSPGDDYPDFVTPLAGAVAAGQVERGVAICGSGVGASVCGNKIAGVRAALIHDHFSARQGVEDDRPSASLAAETDASACYLAAAANGCAAAAGRFSLRNPRTCRSAIWICLGFAFHGYRVTWAFGAR